MKTTIQQNPIYSLNCRGRLVSLRRPLVMGILNLTPDSFSDGGKYNHPTAALQHVAQMLEEGADIIDIGGFSSRPGAAVVETETELARIEGITQEIVKAFPQAILCVDTYRPEVAARMLDIGVHIINDITGGRGLTDDLNADSGMLALIARVGNVPYILMHMQGTPSTMQQQPQYDDVVAEVGKYFVSRLKRCLALGLKDIIIDPGFGFGKEILHNHQLLAGLDRLIQLDRPVLVGLSRKSMMYKLFDTTPDDVLDLTTALHIKALTQGVKILRVHDVREAVRAIKLFQYWQTHGSI